MIILEEPAAPAEICGKNVKRAANFAEASGHFEGDLNWAQRCDAEAHQGS